MNGAPYTEAEDARIIQMVGLKRSSAKIAAAINRSRVSVRDRILRLRKAGRINPWEPKGAYIEPTGNCPPLVLDHDDLLIRLTLLQGGMPRAVVVQGRTFWVGPDDQPWSHRITQRLPRRKAA